MNDISRIPPAIEQLLKPLKWRKQTLADYAGHATEYEQLRRACAMMAQRIEDEPDPTRFADLPDTDIDTAAQAAQALGFLSPPVERIAYDRGVDYSTAPRPAYFGRGAAPASCGIIKLNHPEFQYIWGFRFADPDDAQLPIEINVSAIRDNPPDAGPAQSDPWDSASKLTQRETAAAWLRRWVVRIDTLSIKKPRARGGVVQLLNDFAANGMSPHSGTSPVIKAREALSSGNVRLPLPDAEQVLCALSQRLLADVARRAAERCDGARPPEVQAILREHLFRSWHRLAGLLVVRAKALIQSFPEPLMPTGASIMEELQRWIVDSRDIRDGIEDEASENDIVGEWCTRGNAIHNRIIAAMTAARIEPTRVDKDALMAWSMMPDDIAERTMAPPADGRPANEAKRLHGEAKVVAAERDNQRVAGYLSRSDVLNVYESLVARAPVDKKAPLRSQYFSLNAVCTATGLSPAAVRATDSWKQLQKDLGGTL